MKTLYFPLNTTKNGDKTFFHLSFGLCFPAPVRRCVFASERIFPAVSELIQRSTERFRTLGRAPLTHCVSAVNSRSVSCISAVFGPILELTQEIGPFWQPLPAGTAHSSPGTFCSTHMQVQICMCFYTQGKKGGKTRRYTHTQSWFFLDFPLFLLTGEIFFPLLNELEGLFAGCFAALQIPDRRETMDFQLQRSAGDLQQSSDFNSGLFPPPLYFSLSPTE